jgi:hypothetical protein
MEDIFGRAVDDEVRQRQAEEDLGPGHYPETRTSLRSELCRHTKSGRQTQWRRLRRR